MPGPWPNFWSQPVRYLRWAAVEKPALFWSCVFGAAGPLSIPFYRPLKTYMTGWQPRPDIPITYPIPTGQRQSITEYDDNVETQWHWEPTEKKE